jgi:O-antigen/teichoic acid export membrane protein
MSIIRQSIKGTIWLTASQLISIAIGAVSTVFIARYLGPDEYGYLPLIASIVGIAMIFGDAGLGPSTSYFLAHHQDNKEYSSGLLCKALKLRFLTILPLCVIFMYVMPQISGFLNAPLLKDKLAIAVAFLFFVEIMFRWTGKAYEGLGEAYRLGRSQVFLSWIGPLSKILLVALGFGVLGAICGQVFGSVIIVTLLMLLLLRKHKLKKVTGNIDNLPVSYSQIIRYALPLMVIHAGFFVYMQSDILILKYFRNIEDVSYYGLIVQLAVLIQIPALSFGKSTAPLVASVRENPSEKTCTLVRQSLRYIVIVYAPIALFLYILSPTFITVIFSQKYLPSVPILRIYIPFIFCFAIAGFASLTLDYSGKARLRMIFVGISAIANVGLNLWLVPRFGMVGAAWATQVTYVPLVVIYVYLITKLYNISLKGSHIFLIKLSCALGLSGILLVLIQSITANRYITLIVGTCSATILYGFFVTLTGAISLNNLKKLFVKG